jgi:hypothetical protein
VTVPVLTLGTSLIGGHPEVLSRCRLIPSNTSSVCKALTVAALRLGKSLIGCLLVILNSFNQINLNTTSTFKAHPIIVLSLGISLISVVVEDFLQVDLWCYQASSRWDSSNQNEQIVKSSIVSEFSTDRSFCESVAKRSSNLRLSSKNENSRLGAPERVPAGHAATRNANRGWDL